MNEALCEQINRTIDRIELKDVMRGCELKPTIYTDGTYDYKIIKLNDDRVINLNCIVKKRIGCHSWMIIGECAIDYKDVEIRLNAMVKQMGLTMKQ